MAELPRLWRCLMQACQVPDALAWQGWQGLRRARWSTTKAWRQGLLLFEQRPRGPQTPDAVQAWIVAHAQPLQVMEVLEQLYCERQLSRRVASQLQEAVLQTTNANGTWK